jgi:hypothetical protein
MREMTGVEVVVDQLRREIAVYADDPAPTEILSGDVGEKVERLQRTCAPASGAPCEPIED